MKIQIVGYTVLEGFLQGIPGMFQARCENRLAGNFLTLLWLRAPGKIQHWFCTVKHRRGGTCTDTDPWKWARTCRGRKASQRDTPEDTSSACSARGDNLFLRLMSAQGREQRPSSHRWQVRNSCVLQCLDSSRRSNSYKSCLHGNELKKGTIE